MVFWDEMGSWEFPSAFHTEDAGEAFFSLVQTDFSNSGGECENTPDSRLGFL